MPAMKLFSSDERIAKISEWSAASILTVFVVYAHARVQTYAGPLWRDEISSLRVATMPSVSEFWSSFVYDPVPALFFSLLRFWHWLGFGSTDEGLRQLGLFIGLATVAAVWLAAWTIRRSPPNWGLVLFGLSPVVLVWGDSLRAYGLGCVWNIWLISLLWRLLSKRPRPQDILFATLVALLSVHTLFPNALFVFAASASAIVVALRHRWWHTATVIAGIGTSTAISLLPYASTIRQTQTWTGLAKGTIDFAWILKMIFQAIHTGGNVAAALWIVGAIAACVALCVGCARSWRSAATDRENDLMLYAGMTFLVALLSTVCFFRLVGWTTSVWYYVPLMATGAICLDALSGVLRKGAAPVIVNSLLLIAAAALLGPTAYRATQIRLTNVDLIAATISAQAHESDLIVIDNCFYAISFNRYYHGRTPWVSVPELQDLSLHRWDLLIAAMRTTNPIEPVLKRIDETLRAGHNVFVVGFAPAKRPVTRPPDLPPAPNTTSGWILWPYLRSWTFQVAYAAQTHALHGVIISAPCPQPVSAVEKLNAFVVSGWRDEPRVTFH
jgi:uncharacterized membrane protein